MPSRQQSVTAPRRPARPTLTAADYRQLLDLVNVIVWRADARTFQTTFASSRAENILGYPLSSWMEVPNFWIDHLHSDVMRGTASPSRMRHLRQVMEHEGGLAALTAKARAEMAEPARG